MQDLLQDTGGIWSKIWSFWQTVSVYTLQSLVTVRSVSSLTLWLSFFCNTRALKPLLTGWIINPNIVYWRLLANNSIGSEVEIVLWRHACLRVPVVRLVFQRALFIWKAWADKREQHTLPNEFFKLTSPPFSILKCYRCTKKLKN